MANAAAKPTRGSVDAHERGKPAARTRITRAATAPQPPQPRDDPHRLQIAAPSCGLLDALPGQSLSITYWFDAPTVRLMPARRIRLVGALQSARSDASETLTSARAFDVVRTIPSVPAGVGRVSVTMRVADVAPGRWHVVAHPEDDAAFAATGETGTAVVAAESAPGVALGAWSAFVAIGALVGLVLFSFQIQSVGLPMLTTLALAFGACLVGLIGAKVYFKAQATSPASWLSSGGMCVQGFIIGALTVLALGASFARLPLLTVLDAASAPLLVGISIGRIGCFRAGCCAGRPSAQRIAMWSSDRQLGVRRIPTQLLEGMGALGLAVLAVLMFHFETTMPAGALVLQSLGGYVLLRQTLLPYRALPRREGWRRPFAAALSAAATLIAVSVMAMAAA